MAELLQPLKQRFFSDALGNALAGGKLYTYEAGTTTPKTTYQDQAAASPNTNPVILDSNGEADVWLGTGSYKFVLKDADDNTIYTVDNVSNVGPQDADDLPEGSTNKYYTDAKVDTRIGLADIGDLANVTETTPAAGEILKYSGSAWVNELPRKRTAYSTTNTAAANDDIIELSGASFTLSLPTASGIAGKVYEIFHNGTNVTQAYTIDPSGAETIGGSATTIMYLNGEKLKIMSNGTNWVILERTFPNIDAQLYLDTGAGHGSTNNKIRIFTNTRLDTLGNLATYASTAAAGMSVTINLASRWAVTYTDINTGSGFSFGLSVNNAALTTSLFSTSYANGKRAISSGTTNVHSSVSAVLNLASGDVLRAHTDGTPNGTTDNQFFRMVYLGPNY